MIFAYTRLLVFVIHCRAPFRHVFILVVISVEAGNVGKRKYRDRFSDHFSPIGPFSVNVFGRALNSYSSKRKRNLFFTNRK